MKMQHPMEEVLSLKDIWTTLCEVALTDDKITKDEYSLIRGFTDQIESYKELLTKVLEDGIIDGSERLLLFQAKYEIIMGLLEAAKRDDKISLDEFELLKKIKEFLRIIEESETKL